LAEEKKKELKDMVPESNILALVSYLWVLSIVMYILKKDDKFVVFHARQGMVLFALSIVGIIPVIGWPIMIISFVLIVIGAVKAYKGEKYEIPVIAKIAEKINF